jgi:hypothetical protein
MATTFQLETTVLPGNRLEISNPALPEGEKVTITVVVPEPRATRTSMVEFLASLPTGPRAFPTWQEYNEHLREEKDSWDR